MVFQFFKPGVMLLLVCNLGNSPGGNWPLYTEGKERQKKEADHSRFVGGRFNKQGNLHTKEVCLGQVQDE